MFDTFIIYSVSFIIIALSFILNKKGLGFLLLSTNLVLLAYDGVTTDGNYLSRVFLVVLSLFYVETIINIKKIASEEITKRIFLTTGFYALIYENDLFIVGLVLIFVDILTNYTLELKEKKWLQNLYETYAKHIVLLFFITLYFFTTVGGDDAVIKYLAIMFGSFVIFQNIQLFKSSYEFKEKFQLDFKMNGLFNSFFVGILTNFYIAKCLTVLLKEMPGDFFGIYLWTITILILSSLGMMLFQFLVYKTSELLIYRYAKILGLCIYSAYISLVSDHDTVFSIAIIAYLAFSIHAYLSKEQLYFNKETKLLSIIFLIVMPFNPLFELFNYGQLAEMTQIIISFCIILSGCIMLYGTLISYSTASKQMKLKHCPLALLYGVTIVGMSLL